MPVADRIREHHRRYRADNDFVDPLVPKQYPPDVELEPVHRDIDLFIDIENKTASGTVTVTVRSRRNSPTAIELDAVDFLDVKAGDPDGRDLSWTYDGRKLKLNWADAFSAGEERRVAISYRVVRPVDGLFFSKPDEQYPDRTWYAATDHETERARYWLPCLDLPTVRTTVDFHLRAENRFTILANGLLVEETTHGDGTKTAHWKLEQLCPSYLICFIVGDLIKADDGVFNDGEKDIPLVYFCGPEYGVNDLMNSFGRTRKMMAWMTKKLDMPFPYPKYYQFSVPMMGGAMENISLVSWGDWAMMDDTIKEEVEFWIDQVNVHEMAHSYFGDAVVIRDFAHAWLKESWATYMEQCYREDEYGPDEDQLVLYDDTQRYLKEADERYVRPIVTRHFKSSWQMYDSHLYPGGACRLRTLRNELGDEVFWPAVRDYLKRYSGKVVETDDFRHVMEEHSGRSLGKFFDQWFHSPGYPSLEVSFDYDSKQKKGTFKIEQKQVDIEKGIPTFYLFTGLGWTIDGVDHYLPVKLEEAKHFFIIDMEKEPEQVRFDPQHKVHHKLSFNPGDAMLRRQLTDAKDVIGRIQAAAELAKTAKRANIEAVVEAYAKEGFWGVRMNFAKILGDANTQAAIEGLVRILDIEQDPQVLMWVFDAAGTYRNQEIKEAIGRRLQGNLPYEARRAAFSAMGLQRQNADWDVLKAGTRETGFQGIVQRGAFTGLASTRKSEAVDILLEQSQYGMQDNRVRRAIVNALADIGQGLEKAKREEVIERLEDLLRDPCWSVSWQAVRGLVTMKAVRAIPAIEAYKNAQSAQLQVFIDKFISRMQDEDRSDGSAVKKQLEDLTEKLRKLEDTVQKLEAKLEPASNGGGSGE